MVYVQVVVLAVYTYFITALMSNQYTNAQAEANIVKIDYVPILIILQFIFYMGWLKVAETMINPFGKDDDDFEVNYLIDLNIQTSYLIVDEMHHEHPELLKDQYWDQIPTKLPDRDTGEKGHSSQLGTRDIFDVNDSNQKVAPRTLKRGTHVSIQLNDDNIPSTSNVSLKPRADVIDKMYHRLSNVVESQSTLESYMQMIRSQNLGSSDPSATSSWRAQHDSLIRKFKYV